MKPNGHMSIQFKGPESALARSRREQAMMAELEGRMARELEWEAHHGATAPERREFAKRMVTLLRRPDQRPERMLA